MSSGLSGLLMVAALMCACAPAAAASGQQPRSRSLDQPAAQWPAMTRLGVGQGRWRSPGLVIAAQGGACTASCRSAYNQCRVQTKGHPRCDAQFTSCMHSCIPKGR